MRRPTIVGTLVGASLLTLLSAGSVASGGWYGPTRVVADDYPVSPSVVLKAGVFHAAYLHTQPIGGDVANGIFYASTQTGVWTKERVTTGDDFYARPSIAVDDQGGMPSSFSPAAIPRRAGSCLPPTRQGRGWSSRSRRRWTGSTWHRTLRSRVMTCG